MTCQSTHGVFRGPGAETCHIKTRVSALIRRFWIFSCTVAKPQPEKFITLIIKRAEPTATFDTVSYFEVTEIQVTSPYRYKPRTLGERTKNTTKKSRVITLLMPRAGCQSVQTAIGHRQSCLGPSLAETLASESSAHNERPCS
jgi:hypothetical protein